MTITNRRLKRRIIEISYKYKLSHLGSCLTACDIIWDIFKTKRPGEKFVLSSGHAGLALYCVIEEWSNYGSPLGHGLYDAEEIFKHHGVHPDRCESCGLDCSSGSLGQGLPIAVGMALADRTKNVYCLISDGEMSEGSIAESLRIIKEQKLSNLKLYVNANSWGAYKRIDPMALKFQLSMEYGIPDIYLNITNSEQVPFLKGQDAHYHVMDEKDYKLAMKILK